MDIQVVCGYSLATICLIAALVIKVTDIVKRREAEQMMKLARKRELQQILSDRFRILYEEEVVKNEELKTKNAILEQQLKMARSIMSGTKVIHLKGGENKNDDR